MHRYTDCAIVTYFRTSVKGTSTAMDDDGDNSTLAGITNLEPDDK